MSYDISFRVKVQDLDLYIEVGKCDANITWNVGDIIRKSTGLPWENEANNGLCRDVIPLIKTGMDELLKNGAKYRHLEPKNGWGSVSGVITFFQGILDDWHELERWKPELADVATFWIT